MSHDFTYGLRCGVAMWGCDVGLRCGVRKVDKMIIAVQVQVGTAWRGLKRIPRSDLD